MDLLLMCPCEFQCPEQILAELVCRNSMLQGRRWDVNTSGNEVCLKYAVALCKEMGTRLIVDYRWDDIHTEGQAEPRRIPDARYLVDWFGMEDQESFSQRFSSVVFENVPQRLVLLSRSVMDKVYPTEPVFLILFRVTGGSITAVQNIGLQEMQTFVQERMEGLSPLRELKQSLSQHAKVDVTDLIKRIVSAASTALAEIQPKGMETSDLSSVFASLNAQISSEVQEITSRLDAHYSQSLSAATEVIRGAMKQTEDSFRLRMSEARSRIQQLEAQQRDALEQVSTLQSALERSQAALADSEALSKKLTGLEAAARLYDSKIKLLYEGLPEGSAHKSPPLKLDIKSGQRVFAANRKRYTLENATVIVTAQGKAPVVASRNFPPGSTEIDLNWLTDVHGLWDIIVKMNDEVISNKLTLKVSGLQEPIEEPVRKPSVTSSSIPPVKAGAGPISFPNPRQLTSEQMSLLKEVEQIAKEKGSSWMKLQTQAFELVKKSDAVDRGALYIFNQLSSSPS